MLYQSLDTPDNDEMPVVDCKNFAAELELRCLIEPEEVAGLMEDQISVENEGEGVVQHQCWSPHLPSGSFSVHMVRVLDPSVKNPVLGLYGLCRHRHLVYDLVRDWRRWNG